MRKIKEDKAVLNMAITKPDLSELKLEDMESDEEDDYVRSRIFYRLQDMLDELDSQTEFVSPAKKKLILHKINKLSEKGIFTREETMKRMETNDSPHFDTHRKSLLLEKMSKTKLTLENLATDMQPMTSEEFVEFYMQKRKVDYPQARKVADGLYSKLESTGQIMTRFQAFKLLNKYAMRNMNRIIPTQDNIAKLESVVLPTRFPVTPFPDLTDYEPSDFYDLRAGPGTPINNSRVKTQWFDASPNLKKHTYNTLLPTRHPFPKGEKEMKFSNLMLLSEPSRYENLRKGKKAFVYSKAEKNQQTVQKNMSALSNNTYQRSVANVLTRRKTMVNNANKIAYKDAKLAAKNVNPFEKK